MQRPAGRPGPDLTYDVNHRATVRLARGGQGRPGSPRFLFSSSCSLYGSGTDDAPLDELRPFAPLTPYGEIEDPRRARRRRPLADDFSPVFLRNATAYGFSPRLRGDLVVNDLVGSCACSPARSSCAATAAGLAPLVHAEDICAASQRCSKRRERIHGRAFNVGQTAENYLIRDVRRAGRANSWAAP